MERKIVRKSENKILNLFIFYIMEDLDKMITYYDKSKDEFNKKFPKINSTKFKDSNIDLVPSLIYINDTPFEYNVIGRYDDSTNIWEWGWLSENVKNKVYFINQLIINYAININEFQDYLLLKNILMNSKIQISNKLNIDIILAITLKFLSSNNFKYIHSIKDGNIHKYYIIKPKHQ